MSDKMRRRLVGYLGTCQTPECGRAHGYFCVRCHHYVSTCLCSVGACACRLADGTPDDSGWASKGERKAVREKLLAAQEANHANQN